MQQALNGKDVTLLVESGLKTKEDIGKCRDAANSFICRRVGSVTSSRFVRPIREQAFVHIRVPLCTVQS